MVTPTQLTVLITAIGYPCRTYTMSNTHRNPQLFKAFFIKTQNDTIELYLVGQLPNKLIYIKEHGFKDIDCNLQVQYDWL